MSSRPDQITLVLGADGVAALRARAQAEGVTPAALVRRWLVGEATPEPATLAALEARTRDLETHAAHADERVTALERAVVAMRRELDARA